MSNLQRIPFSFFFVMESITSFAIRHASQICLPAIEAFWAVLTSLLITFFSLLARTFAISLYRRFTRLIGLKSLMSSAPPFFGTKTMNFEFRLHVNLAFS